MRGPEWVSHILQGVVEALWTDATTAEQLQATAACYTARRTALLVALARHGISASGRSGLNVWIPVPEEVGAVQSYRTAPPRRRTTLVSCSKSRVAI